MNRPGTSPTSGESSGADLTVSIALLTFNGYAFLEEQLNSIAEQTRPPDEVVIGDDGSSDGTMELIMAFADRAPFEVKVLADGTNHGLLANAERCLKCCRGDIILLCDQDDVWRPGKVARFLEEFSRSDASLVFSDARLVDRDLHPVGKTLWQVEDFCRSEQMEMHQGGAIDVLLRHNVVQSASLGIRRSLVDLVCPIPTGLSHRIWVHDGWIAFIAAAVGRLQAIPDSLIDYRQHGSNLVAHYSGSSGLRKDLGILLANVTKRCRGGYPTAEFRDGLRARTAQLDLVAGRIADVATGPRSGDGPDLALSKVEAAAAHYRRRADMPLDLNGRARKILSEWSHGQYRQHSSGWRSMARDLIQC